MNDLPAATPPAMPFDTASPNPSPEIDPRIATAGTPRGPGGPAGPSMRARPARLATAFGWAAIVVLAGCGRPPEPAGSGESPAPEMAGSLVPEPADPIAADSASGFESRFAGTPVRWFRWGDEPFEVATRLERPVFLFIGYPACPWCEQMRSESFADPGLADFLNRHFVPVLVDSEALPAVSRSFMTYRQIVSGPVGGWPLCVWLTPDRLPFSAGHYYPPERTESMPSLRSVLEHLAGQWERFPDHYASQTERDMEALAERVRPQEQDPGWTIPPRFEEEVIAALSSEFDPVNGGFGSSPKFPYPVKLDFLAGYLERRGRDADRWEDAARMLRETLENIRVSAMVDPLTGAIFRYSSDTTWNAPNFEQNLYDQALVAATFLRAARLFGDAGFREAGLAMLAAIDARFADPDSAGFFGSFAAAAPDPEGALRPGWFHTWSLDEVGEAVGPDDLPLVRDRFGLRTLGNLPPGNDPQGHLRGRNVLRLAATVAEVAAGHDLSVADASRRLDAASERMRASRSQRPSPSLDRKIVLAWNAYLVSAWVEADRLLGDGRWRRRAESLARWLLDHHGARREAGELDRLVGPDGSGGVPAASADYAALVAALLDLHDSDPASSGGAATPWLREAARLQQTHLDRFLDRASGAFREQAGPRPLLFEEVRSAVDGTEPPSNALTVRNLARLSERLGQARLADVALQTASCFREQLGGSPAGSCALASALAAVADALETTPGAAASSDEEPEPSAGTAE